MNLVELVAEAHKLRTDANAEWSIAVKEQHAPTCVPGCAFCCRLMVFSTLTEALEVLASGAPAKLVSLAILEGREQMRQLNRFGWSADLSEAGHAARRMAIAEVARRWVKGNLQCPFHDAAGLCSIYPVRPTTCATHWALSPPASCASPRDPYRRIANADPIKYAIEVDLELRKAIGVAGPPYMLPFGVMLGEALDLLTGRAAIIAAAPVEAAG
jgi:Fe-S-cluster containining protein